MDKKTQDFLDKLKDSNKNPVKTFPLPNNTEW